MDPDLAAYLAWLRGHGAAFRVAGVLARDPDHDGPLLPGSGTVRTLTLEGVRPIVEHRDPSTGITADHATESVAREMGRRPHAGPGVRAAEAGCGTGVLAVLAAVQGAAPVHAVDLDPRALALARRTAAAAGVDLRVHEGSLLEPLPGEEPLDLVIANLPHKPVPEGVPCPLSQAGGPEGDRLHAALLPQALGRLSPRGRAIFFLHSLPHPRLLRAYGEALDLVLLSWKRRFLRTGEFGALADHFRARARAGTSFLGARGGREFLLCGVWSASREEVRFHPAEVPPP